MASLASHTSYSSCKRDFQNTLVLVDKTASRSPEAPADPAKPALPGAEQRAPKAQQSGVSVVSSSRPRRRADSGNTAEASPGPLFAPDGPKASGVLECLWPTAGMQAEGGPRSFVLSYGHLPSGSRMWHTSGASLHLESHGATDQGIAGGTSMLKISHLHNAIWQKHEAR